MSENQKPLRESGAAETAADIAAVEKAAVQAELAAVEAANAETEPPMPPAPQISIRERAISGTKWTMGGFAAANIMRLAGNVIVGHIWKQAAPFGLMQLANAVLQGVQMLSDVGISQNIVQSKRGDDPTFLNTAWTVQVIRGVLLWFVLLAVAYPFSWFYGESSLLYVIPMIGLAALFGGFNGTAIYTLNKRLDVRSLTLMQLASQAAGVSVMILVAFFIHNVIALACAGVVQALVRLVISHRIDRTNRNRFCWDKESLRSLLGFGSVVFISTALTFAGQQSDKFILAKQISMEDFGLYGVALMISRMPLDVILNLGTGIAFPAYSHAINAGRRLSEIFHKVRFPLVTSGAFVMAGVATTGPDVVRLIWNSAFHGAAQYIPILTVSAMFQVLELTSGQALLALGKVKYLAIGNALRLLTLAGGLILGYHFAGFWGALVGMIAADVVRYVVSAFFARQEGLPIFRHDFLLFVMTVAAYYAATFVQNLVPEIQIHWVNEIVRILVGGAVVTAIFAWPLRLIAKEFFARRAAPPQNETDSSASPN